MTTTKEIREWLLATVGPSVAKYTDQQVLNRFQNIKGFYGSQILKQWTPPIPDTTWP